MRFTNSVVREGNVLHALISYDTLVAPSKRQEATIPNQLRQWLEAAFDVVEGNRGTVVSMGVDHLIAVVDHDTGATVDTAIAWQEWLLSNRTPARSPVELQVGVAHGEVELLHAEAKARFDIAAGPRPIALGAAALRAHRLAAIAPRGAILSDTWVIADLDLRYLESDVGRARGWKGSDYIGQVQELRSDPNSPPLAYHEIKWSGEELLRDDAAPPSDTPPRDHRTIGAFNRWNPGGRASISGDDGEIFWTSERHILGGERLEPGRRVSFVALDPEPGTATRRAGAVVAFGSRVQGRIVSVFDTRNYAFVRVEDLKGISQDLFLHGDDNEWPLEVSDEVEFTVGENVRGATAMGARRTGSG